MAARVLEQSRTSTPYDALRDPVRRLIDQGAFAAALKLLIDLSPAFSSEPRMLDDMATCYWNLGDHATAIKLLQLAVDQAPRNAAAWGKLGALLISAGDGKAAQNAFAKVLKINPKSVPALAALNRIQPFERTGHRTRTLRRLSTDKGLSPADRATALNALGRIEEAAGNTGLAFRFFCKSKALTPGTYDAAAIDRHVADQLRFYEGASAAPSASAAGPRPIFVTGLPRSGTTLVERILTRHPDIGTIGESPALQEALQIARKTTRKPGETQAGWDWITRITPDQLATCRDHYLMRMRQRFIGPLPGVIVDKLPLNCLEMGFARMILPVARFVFLSRHPLDVGLSLLATHFHEAHPFARRPETIAHLTRAVYRSLDDYEAKLGAALRRQSYRALVEQPDEQIRALLDHVGADWDPACLAPETGEEMVRTASLTQVRAPITPKAVGKWRRYEAELQPLAEALGGPNWIEHWQKADDACAGQGAVSH